MGDEYFVIELWEIDLEDIIEDDAEVDILFFVADPDGEGALCDGACDDCDLFDLCYEEE